MSDHIDRIRNIPFADEMTEDLVHMVCIIHRDGGHYIQQHGLEKAYADAIDILHRWKTLPDELETERKLAELKSMFNAISELLAGVQADLTQREQQLAQAQMHALGKKLLLEEKEKQIVMLREYLERLACLGNGDRHGNSLGNDIAIEALNKTQDLSGLVLCEAEPVAWMFIDDEEHGYYAFNRSPPTKEQVEYLAQENRPAWNPLYQARKAI